MERTFLLLLLLLLLWADVDFTLTQEDVHAAIPDVKAKVGELQYKMEKLQTHNQDQAKKLDTYEVQLQQQQNKTQDRAGKLEKSEVQLRQLQNKSQDDHALLRQLRAELALLQTKLEALEQNQSRTAVQDELGPDPCKFVLDPNTAHERLRLSEDGLSVTNVGQDQPYPDHQDRFTDGEQVLSSSGLRGRCYWEVDWTVVEGGGVDVAVSSRRICRFCDFGNNNHSWSLRITDKGKFSVWHHRRETQLPSRVGVSSGRVGVFLDWEGGALSFYDVTNRRRPHLYTFRTTFTEELLPGFTVAWLSTVSVVNLNQV